MKVVVWNLRRATAKSPTWDYLLELAPDVALLQEVSGMPAVVSTTYRHVLRPAAGKAGKSQRFNTAVLVRGTLVDEIPLVSKLEWVNKELARFNGNLVAQSIRMQGGEHLRVLSAYSPAWPVSPDRLLGIDTSTIKLVHSPKVWVTEILWDALRSQAVGRGSPWIVAGDLNSSETFDQLWPNGPHGNREILDRMDALGFTECLRHANGRLVPTFRNPRGQRLVHQLDHLFVSADLATRLLSCTTGDERRVFDHSLSDHLPIIAEFAACSSGVEPQ